MRDISLLTADIRCCDDVIRTDENQLEFAWECWFDVDAYFGTNTQCSDDKWIDFMTYWGRYDNDITAIYVIDGDDGLEQHEWVLTDEEKAYLREKMEAYIGKSFVEYFDDGEENLAEWEVESGKKFLFKTDYSDYKDIGCSVIPVTIVRPLIDIEEYDKADVGAMWLAKSDNGKDFHVYLDELSRMYPENDKVRYIISISEIPHENEVLYGICCNEAVVDGKKKILHNEIGCCLDYSDYRFKVISGWHIGTEDFTWNDDGYEWVLEKYHPGISAQIVEMLEARKKAA